MKLTDHHIRSQGGGGGTTTGARGCDHPGCPNDGAFRAPRARDRLTDYYWFCLDHVRAYNSGWDFYAGMSPEQIEVQVREDTTWQRPTWPMGSGAARRAYVHGVHDPYDVFTDAGLKSESGPVTKPRPPREAAAMSLLGVTDPLQLPDLKARYKELVKQHHPDANGGNRLAEERFKEINAAYTVLLHTFDPPTRSP